MSISSFPDSLLFSLFRNRSVRLSVINSMMEMYIDLEINKMIDVQYWEANGVISKSFYIRTYLTIWYASQGGSGSSIRVLFVLCCCPASSSAAFLVLQSAAVNFFGSDAKKEELNVKVYMKVAICVE